MKEIQAMRGNDRWKQGSDVFEQNETKGEGETMGGYKQ
jgi:hypothetical protein